MSGLRVIAIDGPAGSGKSTVARAVAERLGWDYLDTGAMYRALCLEALREGVDPDDEERLVELLDGMSFRIGFEEGTMRVWIDDREVSDALRQDRVSRNVSRVARLEGVRKTLVQKQRRIGRKGPVVMEGRDIGTVVFPDARFKFYLDAPLEVRARRRYTQLREQDPQATFDQVLRGLKERDRKDRSRSASPMKPADDAVHIDTGGMDVDEVVQQILDAVGP